MIAALLIIGLLAWSIGAQVIDLENENRMDREQWIIWTVTQITALAAIVRLFLVYNDR